jgi:hypothetical protein
MDYLDFITSKLLPFFHSTAIDQYCNSTTSTRATPGTWMTTVPYSKVPSAGLFCSQSSLLVVSLRLVTWFIFHLYTKLAFPRWRPRQAGLADASLLFQVLVLCILFFQSTQWIRPLFWCIGLVYLFDLLCFSVCTKSIAWSICFINCSYNLNIY